MNRRKKKSKSKNIQSRRGSMTTAESCRSLTASSELLANTLTVGASMLAMVVNDNAFLLV